MDPLIQEFLDSEKNKRRPTTFENRKTGLNAFQEWLEKTGEDVLQVTPLAVEDFVGWLISDQGRGVTDGSASTYTDQVSAFYQYLEKRANAEYGDDFDLDNPVREADVMDIIDPSETKMSRELHDDEGYVAMTPDQYQAFSNNIPSPKARNQLVFQLMWDCGLRPSEVAGIRLQDLDRDTREIAIRSDKTYLNRTVFYGDAVAQMLRIWLDAGERDRYNPSQQSAYLLVSERSEQISTNLIQEEFLEAIDSSGLEPEPQYRDAKGRARRRLKPYSLRHGFAERMVDKVDLETLRDVMGHKNLETTKQYLNPDKEERRQKIQGALDD